MKTENSDKEILYEISQKLRHSGYDAVGQIIGFLVTEDPTYITNKEGARKLALGLDRDTLLKEIVECYCNQL